jgi:hypothetical protein
LTSLDANQFPDLLIELAQPWEDQVESIRERRRGHALS